MVTVVSFYLAPLPYLPIFVAIQVDICHIFRGNQRSQCVLDVDGVALKLDRAQAVESHRGLDYTW